MISKNLFRTGQLLAGSRVLALLISIFFITGINFKTQAQYVYIPDPNFRAYLQDQFPGCFSGDNMDTTCNAVMTTTGMSPQNLGIADLEGLQYFDHLQYFYCTSNQITTLPPLPHGLIILGCTNNQITSLPPLPSGLSSLLCENNLLTSLPALPDSIWLIQCQNNHLTTFPSLPPSLLYLYADSNQLTVLPSITSPLVALYVRKNNLNSLPDLSNLSFLKVDSNLLTSLPSLPANMQELTCSHNQLQSLPSGSPLPSSLNCSYNQLTSLPDISQVYELNCSHNLLTYLPPIPNYINSLDVSYNQITILPPLPVIPDTSFSIQFSLNISSNPINCLPILTNNIQLTFCNTNITCLPNLPSNSIFDNCTGSTPPVCSGGDCTTYNVSGYAFVDYNNNCVFDAGEPPLLNKLIEINSGQYYANTDSNGYYSFYVGMPGSYQLSQVISYPQLWDVTCFGNSHSVNVVNATDTFNNRNFPNSIINHCAYNIVDIGTPYQRFCKGDNTYVINYCNAGTDTALNSYIEIEFDPEVIPLSSTLPWSFVSGNIYTFEVGNLAPNECGSFIITDSVSCDATIEQTACVQAHIFPDSTCEPVDSLWDGSTIRVSGYCNASNDTIVFTVRNSGAGDMTQYSEVSIYEDDLLLFIDSAQLNSGDSVLYDIPADGKTYRFEAEQSAHHPGHSQPRSFVELCGNPPYSLGYIVTIPQDDADDWTEIDCHEILSSLDPNDKTSQPSGVSTNHYITAQDDLDYIIDFQNTGNDTAFSIKIIDTLDVTHLDVTTIQPGVTSNPYAFTLEGQGTIKFIFSNIFLPDSNVNEPASHGFVKYKIRQKPGNVPGTIINNKAAIYFDYNDPVITNTTFVTVELKENIFYLGAENIYTTDKNYDVSVYPNPFKDILNFNINDDVVSKNFQVVFYNLIGNEVFRSKNFHSHQFIIEGLNLSGDVYLYKVFDDHKLIAGGKLVAQ